MRDGGRSIHQPIRVRGSQRAQTNPSHWLPEAIREDMASGWTHQGGRAGSPSRGRPPGTQTRQSTPWGLGLPPGTSPTLLP